MLTDTLTEMTSVQDSDVMLSKPNPQTQLTHLSHSQGCAYDIIEAIERQPKVGRGWETSGNVLQNGTGSSGLPLCFFSPLPSSFMDTGGHVHILSTNMNTTS